MKKLYIILTLIALAISSCNEWLDIRSSEEVLEDDAFATNRGYRTALTGVYRIVASEGLWGRELTWGFLSVVGRNYNEANLPTRYRKVITDGHYEDETYVRPIIDDIWKTAYSAIANCNNILVNIDNLPASEFEYPWEKEMIVAEARGLRALLHFELMRLFVPAPSTGYSGRAIPYSDTYPDLHPEYKTMNEVFDLVIADLLYAKEVLRRVDVDNLWEPTIMSYISTPLFWGIQNLRDDGTFGNGFGFFSFRGYKMNYWGATALIARVYSYKRDNETATRYIDELLDEWEDEDGDNIGWGWYQYSSNPNQISGKRVPEPLLSFWNTENYIIYEEALSSVANAFRVIPLAELFGSVDIREDYRYTGLYNSSTQRYRVWDRPNDPAYSIPTGSSTTYSGPHIPVLELPELYYIRCEYLAEQGKISEAVAMLKRVKDNRNITSPIVANDYDSFMRILVNDATRDFLTRGQTWHYLKKLNWKEMYNGTTVNWSVPDNWYVLPIPASETDFY